MYEQTLYRVVEPIKINTIKRLNKSKKWKYGYNKEHDLVVISKTGEIGDIIEIQNFQIALPKVPKKVHKFNSDKWEVTEYPKALKRIKTIFDWKEYPNDFKNQYIDKDDYEFMRQIDDKNITLFKIILYTLLAILLFTTYIIINRVFLVPKKERAPKLLFVVYILIVSLFYLS